MEGASWTDWLPWLGRAFAGLVALALCAVAMVQLPRALRWLARDPRALSWLLAGQAVLILTVLLVPFGFDHPSSWGLDFEDFLIVLALYVLILLSGMVVGSLRKRWLVVVLQVVAPCAVFLLGVLGVLRI